jgi:hypothetical protein
MYQQLIKSPMCGRFQEREEQNDTVFYDVHLTWFARSGLTKYLLALHFLNITDNTAVKWSSICISFVKGEEDPKGMTQMDGQTSCNTHTGNS